MKHRVLRHHVHSVGNGEELCNSCINVPDDGDVEHRVSSHHVPGDGSKEIFAFHVMLSLVPRVMMFLEVFRYGFRL